MQVPGLPPKSTPMLPSKSERHKGLATSLSRFQQMRGCRQSNPSLSYLPTTSVQSVYSLQLCVVFIDAGGAEFSTQILLVRGLNSDPSVHRPTHTQGSEDLRPIDSSGRASFLQTQSHEAQSRHRQQQKNTITIVVNKAKAATNHSQAEV